MKKKYRYYALREICNSVEFPNCNSKDLFSLSLKLSLSEKKKPADENNACFIFHVPVTTQRSHTQDIRDSSPGEYPRKAHVLHICYDFGRSISHCDSFYIKYRTDWFHFQIHKNVQQQHQRWSERWFILAVGRLLSTCTDGLD